MSRQHSIDFETREYDNKDIEITGKNELVHCRHEDLTCYNCCGCYKCQDKETELIRKMEEKISQKGRSSMGMKKHQKKKQVPGLIRINETTKASISKYPRTTISYRDKLNGCVEIVSKEEPYIIHKNREIIRFSNNDRSICLLKSIVFYAGPYFIAEIPNTVENRYDIIYKEIMKSKCKQIFNVLLDIIIDYLLFDLFPNTQFSGDGSWLENFYWKFQLC
jgi:hypothetical protein